MIREPYQVFPYNVAISEDNQNSQGDYLFEFNFNGDIGKFYDFQIVENNNRENVYKDFDEFIPFDSTMYNGDRVIFSVRELPSLKDLIWRVRLSENKGDWTTGNIPTMKLQEGKIGKIDGFKVYAPITGELEEYDTKDLQQAYVSLKSNLGVKTRIEHYESQYYEFYPYGKGSYKVGTITSKSENSLTFSWVKKTTPFGSNFLTRQDAGLQNITLQDDTGVYTFSNLFSDEEFENLQGGVNSTSYSVERYKPDKDIRFLTGHGYTTSNTPVYNLYANNSVGGTLYKEPISRASRGLGQYAYIQYQEGTATRNETVKTLFSEEEVRAIVGDFNDSAPFGQYSISYEKVNDEDHPSGAYYIIYNTTFNDEDEVFVYEITEHLTRYNDDLLANYRGRRELQEGEERITEYPIVKERILQRQDEYAAACIEKAKKVLDSPYLLVQDTSGNILSSNSLFTEEEKDLIVYQTIDTGIYTCDTSLRKESYWAEIYTNTYDSNFYFFKTVSKPTVTFEDEFGDPLGFSEDFDGNQVIDLNSRYSIVRVKERDEIDTKWFKWTLYRQDKDEPEYETDKIFSKNIQFKYSNFLKNYTYNLQLTIETQDNTQFTYYLNDIKVSYPLNSVIKSEPSYNEELDCISVVWSSQRSSIPKYQPFKSDTYFEKFLDWPIALRLHDGTSLTYDNIISEELRIDPNDFLLCTAFSVDETIYRKEIAKKDVVSFLSSYGHYFKIVRRDNEMVLLTSEGSEARFMKLSQEDKEQFLKTADVIQVSTNSVSLNLLDNYYNFAYTTPYNKNKLIYNYYRLPNGNSKLYANNSSMYQTNTELYYTRYKLFLCKEKAVLCQYRLNSSNIYQLFDIYAIDNIGRYLQSYDIANVFYSKMIINEGTIFRYLNLYKLDSIEKKNEVILNEGFSIDLPPEITDTTDMVFKIDFANGQNSIFEGDDQDGEIVGYQIYRNEYEDNSKNILIDSNLIASLSVPQLTHINNNKDFLFKDFSFHNRGYFEYEILPRVNKEIVNEEDGSKKLKSSLGGAIVGNTIYLNNYFWLFTSFGLRADGTYAPNEQWKFILNIAQGNFVHNTQKVFHTGLSKYPKVSVGEWDYLTTTLSALVGNFSHNKVLKYAGQNIINLQKTTRPTSSSLLTRIYIQRCNWLVSTDYLRDQTTLEMNGQTRNIINYGNTIIKEKRYYYVDIDKPFTGFIPGFDQDTYTIIQIKDKSNEKNYEKIGEYNSYEDTAKIVQEWNDFTLNRNLVFVKDIKGNSFVASLSGNNEIYNTLIDQIPTTVNFAITQIGCARDYQVFEP